MNLAKLWLRPALAIIRPHNIGLLLLELELILILSQMEQKPVLRGQAENGRACIMRMEVEANRRVCRNKAYGGVIAM